MSPNPETATDEGNLQQQDDVEMSAADISTTAQDANGSGAGNGYGTGGLENIEAGGSEREDFITHLRSPIVEISVGTGGEETILYAHQGLLVQSEYLATLIQQAGSETTPLRISLPEQDVSALSSSLEYLYKRDYFPKLNANSTLEDDPSVPRPDESGTSLLRHAHIYTLAKLLKLPALASLAHRKIHLVESTAKGEIAYARYIYRHTSEEEEVVRRPVAKFWASRSHVLRHKAEYEFKKMCLEYPQFGFDVLSIVLDHQEKKSAKEGLSSLGGPASQTTGRKRARI